MWGQVQAATLEMSRMRVRLLGVFGLTERKDRGRIYHTKEDNDGGVGKTTRKTVKESWSAETSEGCFPGAVEG